MKRFIALVLLAALALLQAPAHAQARYYEQAELDALLAPVALYPDAVLTNVLIAATYPDDLRDAADWSRANPQLGGDDAVRAAAPMPWHPSLKALVAFPELLARMDESPQWTADLGAAFIAQEPQVMESVQGLRRRAQASGALQSNSQQQVVQQGPTVIVQPVQPQIIYVPYYDPYVVYGPWWWPAYRPVYWRPWHPRPAVFVSATFFSGSVDWHRRHVTYVAPRRVFVQQVQPVNRERRGEWHDRRVEASRPISSFNHVDQAQAASRFQERKLQEQRPIVQGAQLPNRVDASRPVQQPQVARPIAQPAQTPQRSEWREQRREHRAEAPRPQAFVQNTRAMVQAAQVAPQVQRPVQQHMPQAPRPAAQGGHAQQRNQGHQNRGGRG
jgi:hypothetical protein